MQGLLAGLLAAVVLVVQGDLEGLDRAVEHPAVGEAVERIAVLVAESPQLSQGQHAGVAGGGGAPAGLGGGIQFAGEQGELARQVAEDAGRERRGERAHRHRGEPLAPVELRQGAGGVRGTEDHVRCQGVAQFLGQQALAAGDDLAAARPGDRRGRALQQPGVLLLALTAGQPAHPPGRRLTRLGGPVQRRQAGRAPRLLPALGGLGLFEGRGVERHRGGKRCRHTGATPRGTGRSRVQAVTLPHGTAALGSTPAALRSGAGQPAAAWGQRGCATGTVRPGRRARGGADTRPLHPGGKHRWSRG
ncbi:hypothetical protein [Kitasatospora sp. NPDC005748]|uniref:hypothetical protein n=1 Tax=Kitasatospora sp. NPDC005748 TaxID=3157063 RepID=UPI00340CE5B3